MPFPVGEHDVEAVEAALGSPLPAILRARLMRDNGGEIELGDDDVFELFKVLDRTDRTRLARTSASDIVQENARIREWRGFPESAIAIAENGSGDVMVVLRDDGSYDDTLYVWDHETTELIPVGSAISLLR